MVSRRDVLRGVSALGALLASRPCVSQGRVVAVPLRIGKGRVLVDAMIDGAGPVPLAIDTGAMISLLSEAFARKNAYRHVGKLSATIAGKDDRYDVVEARKVVLDGRVDAGRVAFAVFPVETLGDGAVGSISGGVFTIVDSEFDFRAQRLLFFPDGSPPRPGWTRHADAIVRGAGGGTRYIFARIGLGGAGARLLLDTGSPGHLRLDPSFVRHAFPGYERLNWSPLGRSDRERVVRLPVPFALGDFREERPLVRIRAGPAFSPQGIGGLSLLRQLDLATTVRDGTLYTRPNGMPPPAPGYNMSGLWVDRREGRIVAGLVGAGSPAQAAGIRPGDPLEGLEFQAMISALNQPAGERVRIVAAGRPVDLLLADYL